MARGRGSIFRRILHAVFPVIPARPRAKPKPPSPPPRPGTGGAPTGRGGSPRFNPYEQIWMEERLGRAGRQYERNRALFNSWPGIAELPESEQQNIWRIYLRNMVNTSPTTPRRNDPANPFWSATGMHPRSGGFDWIEFRRIMKARGS